MEPRERYKYDRFVQGLLDQVGYGREMKLRNRLKSYRHQKEMNQIEFAEFLGVHPNQYNRWERQAIQPSLETAWILTKKLKIKIDDLFYGEGEE